MDPDVVTVKYLCKISDWLDSNLPTEGNIISRQLREKCISKQDNHRLKLPNTLFGSQVLCLGCLSRWSNGCFSLRQVGRKKESKRRAKKSLNKLIIKNPSKLNKFQSTFLKKISSKERSTMRITCLVCNKKTRIYGEGGRDSFQVKKSEENKIINSSAILINDGAKTKKKKKKKDSYCGLKASAVIAIKKNKVQPVNKS